MKLTKNFDLQEFASKDGAVFPERVIENLKRLAENLQKIRDIIGVPISINSGYRSPAHNKKVGGAKNSQHLTGMAADIVVKGYSPRSVFEIVEDLQNEGVIELGGLHAYNSFTHVDIRGTKARW